MTDQSSQKRDIKARYDDYTHRKYIAQVRKALIIIGNEADIWDDQYFEEIIGFAPSLYIFDPRNDHYCQFQYLCTEADAIIVDADSFPEHQRVPFSLGYDLTRHMALKHVQRVIKQIRPGIIPEMRHLEERGLGKWTSSIPEEVRRFRVRNKLFTPCVIYMPRERYENTTAVPALLGYDAQLEYGTKPELVQAVIIRENIRRARDITERIPSWTHSIISNMEKNSFFRRNLRYLGGRKIKNGNTCKNI